MKIKKINKEFILEKEMIPIIIKEFCQKFDVRYYIEEFETGNGIPDIVFAKGVKHRFHKKMDYDSYHFISEVLQTKEVKFNDKVIDYEKYKELKNYLIKNNYIEEKESNKYIRKKLFKPLLGDIIAIEAKLSDWKNGFYQALRYKYFAHESYLALSKSKIKNVDKSLLNKQGIGLISVDINNIEIIIKPKKSSPINTASYLYSSQKFYETIQN